MPPCDGSRSRAPQASAMQHAAAATACGGGGCHGRIKRWCWLRRWIRRRWRLRLCLRRYRHCRRRRRCIRRTIAVITVAVDSPSPAECTCVSLWRWKQHRRQHRWRICNRPSAAVSRGHRRGARTRCWSLTGAQSQESSLAHHGVRFSGDEHTAGLGCGSKHGSRTCASSCGTHSASQRALTDHHAAWHQSWDSLKA